MGIRAVIVLTLSAVGCRQTAVSKSGAPPAVASQAHVNAGGVAPSGGTLTNPYQTDRASIKEGEQTFASMNCDGCHGGGATGWVGPSLVDGRWRYGGEDGAVFQSIYYGRPRGMPAYGGILSDGVIWKIVAYIRAQPVPAVVPTQSW